MTAPLADKLSSLRLPHEQPEQGALTATSKLDGTSLTAQAGTSALEANNWQPERGRLLWVDCEMTGLNLKTDRIIEIAAMVTDKDLTLLDEGIEYVVRTDKSVLDQMDEWCTKTHSGTGLTQACIASKHSIEEVDRKVTEYVKRYFPDDRSAVLAGSSVHADANFIRKDMPLLAKCLHYRIVDVSSVKELVARWYSLPRQERDPKQGGQQHRARDDIMASIKELKRYRSTVFKPANAVNS
ncbi:uncharacterized protein L969DRAFT_229104 [Mixia osmundae IAM 14324]|uniref:Exonuclease domain-containing protein n=1 Tax=Mixia osmundae (strain CBS 9802 / IAM 14324 / JCM 22182 / KY 12970) TaxID=764103 RepID=G7E279_MIXOS|nr:uncharacterized protein L969DRAFT_229104 [Mixia osmundae IAM 14324]KEI36811.1 hypothetical protein L969DRAFT_229104 [Mixia osmundae IAM 14324]GAA96939.1 hypothetical protein E5Q_03613 [Mixia osmundae IAM 14324]